MAPCSPRRRGFWSARPSLLTSDCALASFLLLSLVVQVHSSTGFNSPPIFNTPRDISIYEDLPVGDHVYTVQALDEEPLVYSIHAGNFMDGSSKLQIDSHSGEITLKESLLGKGGEDMYFKVGAYDGENMAKMEFSLKVKSKDNFAKKPSTIWRGGPDNNPVPRLEEPKWASKPNSTSFTSPPGSSSTRRPAKPRPSISPFNHPTFDHNSSVTSNSSFEDLSLHEKVVVSNANQSSGKQLLSSFLPHLVASFVFLFVSGLVCISLCRCQRNANTRNAIKTFSHKIINNNKSDSADTSSSSFSETDYNGALFRTRKSMVSKEMSSLSDKSFLKVCENEWDFPRHHLKFIHILGEGCFGQVWRCEAVNIGNNGGSQVVAVKTLKQNASQKEKDDLLEELEVMKMLEPHPNVVTLIGCCAEQDPVLLIMEFIPNGTLQTYLRENRTDYGGCIAQSNNRPTSRDLISFAYQIAKGMEYLSSKGVIHRDLAARNVLVGYNKVCKIADFGFAKYDHIYERKSEGRLPIRWMAVESLTDFVFTTKSDVWSFGVLMWEVVTLGWTPYPGFAAAEVIRKVCEGYRLEKPEHCKREMFNIMYYCWDRDPTKRPSFGELVTLLERILYSDSEQDYIELDRFPDHAYYNILKPGTTGEKL